MRAANNDRLEIVIKLIGSGAKCDQKAIDAASDAAKVTRVSHFRSENRMTPKKPSVVQTRDA